MAVDYGVGRGNIGQLYTNLQNAVASEGEAENQREARDIERKGLFGSGIKQSDIQDFGNLAIKGAALGDARMERKMDRATKSFERRVKADERRIASLKERAKVTGSKEAYEKLMGQIQGIEMGMGERRNSFEDYMGKYQEKGLWGTSFGGDDVGYRTEGESRYSQALGRDKLGSGNGDGDQGGMALSADTEHMRQAKAPMGKRSFHDPDAVPDWRQAKAPMGQRSFHDPDAVPDWRQGQTRPNNQYKDGMIRSSLANHPEYTQRGLPGYLKENEWK
jgi:hypothetical protein